MKTVIHWVETALRGAEIPAPLADHGLDRAARASA